MNTKIQLVHLFRCCKRLSTILSRYSYDDINEPMPTHGLRFLYDFFANLRFFFLGRSSFFGLKWFKRLFTVDKYFTSIANCITHSHCLNSRKAIYTVTETMKDRLDSLATFCYLRYLKTGFSLCDPTSSFNLITQISLVNFQIFPSILRSSCFPR